MFAIMGVIILEYLFLIVNIVFILRFIYLNWKKSRKTKIQEVKTAKSSSDLDIKIDGQSFRYTWVHISLLPRGLQDEFKAEDRKWRVSNKDTTTTSVTTMNDISSHPKQKFNSKEMSDNSIILSNSKNNSVVKNDSKDESLININSKTHSRVNTDTSSRDNSSLIKIKPKVRVKSLAKNHKLKIKRKDPKDNQKQAKMKGLGAKKQKNKVRSLNEQDLKNSEKLDNPTHRRKAAKKLANQNKKSKIRQKNRVISVERKVKSSETFSKKIA